MMGDLANEHLRREASEASRRKIGGVVVQFGFHFELREHVATAVRLDQHVFPSICVRSSATNPYRPPTSIRPGQLDAELHLFASLPLGPCRTRAVASIPLPPVDKLWIDSCYWGPGLSCYQEPDPRAIGDRNVA